MILQAVVMVRMRNFRMGNVKWRNNSNSSSNGGNGTSGL